MARRVAGRHVRPTNGLQSRETALRQVQEPPPQRRILHAPVLGLRPTPRDKERAETTVRRIIRGLPRGEIRVLRVTEAQFARMEVFSNFDRRHPELAPSQLELCDLNCSRHWSEPVFRVL